MRYEEINDLCNRTEQRKNMLRDLLVNGSKLSKIDPRHTLVTMGAKVGLITPRLAQAP